MIGLPTTVISKISPRSIAASCGGLADQRVDRRAHAAGQLGVAARVHHDIGDAAHQILAEPDLRIHRAAGGENLAGLEIAEMRGDRRGADVERDPQRAVAEAGKHRDDLAPLAQGDRDLPVAAAQNLLQTAQHGQACLGFADAPLRGQRLLQAPEVARGVVHVGLGDLDIMQANDRIDVYRMRLRALADDLAMHLALGRHINDEIAQDARLAAESAARRQRAALVDPALLHRAPWRHMIFRGKQRVLGEFTLGDIDLTAPADAAAAADRVEIDAEFARDLQHAGAVGDFVAFARRCEDDPMRTQFLSPASRGRRPVVYGKRKLGLRTCQAFEAADPFSRLREKVAPKTPVFRWAIAPDEEARRRRTPTRPCGTWHGATILGRAFERPPYPSHLAPLKRERENIKMDTCLGC